VLVLLLKYYSITDTSVLKYIVLNETEEIDSINENHETGLILDYYKLLIQILLNL
jgi:hypothetical protein